MQQCIDFSQKFYVDLEKYIACSMVKVKVVQLCLTVCNPMDYTVHRLYYFPGQNTGVGILLLHCGQILYQLSQVASVVSDSVRPHRWQPTRLPRPWDSPGKNTGVGCLVAQSYQKGRIPKDHGAVLFCSFPYSPVAVTYSILSATVSSLFRIYCIVLSFCSTISLELSKLFDPRI